MAIVSTACQTNSLQSFMVDHKNDENFISLDFSLKTFVDNFEGLTDEQQAVFEDVRKVNFLAFKKDEANAEAYAEKRNNLMEILNNQFSDAQLMSLNTDGNQMKMYADDMDSKVQEIILYAGNDSKGFMVLRLLGDDLNPSNFYKLMQMSGEIDFDALANMVDM